MLIQRFFFAGSAILLLCGCSASNSSTNFPNPSPARLTDPSLETQVPRKLAVFMDGTANDERSRTNVSQMFNLVNLQRNSSIEAEYIEGVGTKSLTAAAFGLRIESRVQRAYRFLAENYDSKRGDQIFIFGFSRGAYSSRILAGLLHTAGLPDLRNVPESERKAYIGRLFNVYRSKRDITGRRSDLLREMGHDNDPVRVDFLGLWDTVEALGLPDFTSNDRIDPRYIDQLCNVRRAAHAMSLDDNRALSFTPVLLTQTHLISQCKDRVSIDSVVDEVWFAGAHSDVGGGYRDTDISGVSLNWMLDRLRPYELAPSTAGVNQNPLDITHDPQRENRSKGVIYQRKYRNLTALTADSDYNGRRVKIHSSVLERLQGPLPQPYTPAWRAESRFRPCFPDDRTYSDTDECRGQVEIVP